MKKIVKKILIISAGALCFSCAKNELVEDTTNFESEPATFEYIFTITNEGDSKTILDDVTLKWEVGDKIGCYAADNKNKNAAISTIDPKVIFPIYLTSALQAGDKIYCYFPYRGTNYGNPANQIGMEIPSDQDGDSDNMPQVSLPVSITESMSTGSHNIELRFCNLASVARFHIYSTNSNYQTETLEAITISADKAIAGMFSFDATAVDYDTPSTLAISGYESTSVALNLNNVEIAATKQEATTDLDMVVAPGTYTGTITITTDIANYTYNISNKVFTRSQISGFNVDLNNGTRVERTKDTYNKVTELNQITDGDYIITALNESIQYTLTNAEQSAGDVLAIDMSTIGLTPVDNVISTVKDKYTWHISGAESTTVRSVRGEAIYLYATNKNNGIVVGGTDDKWTITTAGDGTFNMKEATNSRYLCLYPTDPNWRCYTTTTVSGSVSALVLYKKADSRPLPGLEGTAASIEAYNTKDVSGMFTSSSTGEITYTVKTAPADADYDFDGTNLTARTIGEYIIKASQAETEQYQSGVAETTLTVTDRSDWTLNKIEITTPPTKTEYEAGECFDPAGMVVTGTYKASADETIQKQEDVTSSCTYEPSTETELTTENTYITVKCGSCSTTQNITVTAAVEWVLMQIEVTTAPTKTAYTVGEYFDPAGMVVTATYSDNAGEKEDKLVDVTSSCSYNPSTDTPLTKENTAITITFQDGSESESTTQAITVNASLSETITLSDGVYSGSKTTGQIVWTGTSCSITQTKGNSSTNVNQSHVSAPRWYASHVIKFASSSGYTIKSVEVTCTLTSYATALKNSTYTTGASAAVSSSVVTITTSGDFNITMGAQSRISAIKVTYITN